MLQRKLKRRFEKVNMENEREVGLLNDVLILTRKYYQSSIIIRQLNYNKNIKVKAKKFKFNVIKLKIKKFNNGNQIFNRYLFFKFF